ncbi:hypothetical protein BKA93DRAFT_823902 [Sparassis latifolia]|uniref:Uncharacterized protein n=1 Tax=Sparassis crispa TaxID=139825 RepID=A0A401GAN0_9APHY|nr:predicted protein [Sparassis crispa]GBE79211.1 predicted protein [Sparassis crispa]
MNFTNINDPAGVKALLERLRSSQAWQDIAQVAPATSSNSHVAPPPPPVHVPRSGFKPVDSDAFTSEAPPSVAPALWTSSVEVAQPSSSSSSVAALLSQLHGSPSFNAVVAPVPPPAAPPVDVNYCGTQHFDRHQPISESQSTLAPCPAAPESAAAPPLAPPAVRKQDLRSYTFQQALPQLARLSEDPEFVKSISAMKEEQADLERQLWEERREIQHKYEDKVNSTRTKAKIIGVGLTQHEADMISDALRKELQNFDSTRAIPAWDGLLAKQQAALQSLGVPAMYPTTVTTDREKQQKIVQVLGGIVGGDGA